MSVPKFTPGPYRIDELDEGAYVIVGCPTWPCRRFGVDGEWEIARIEELEDHPREAAANARLFVMADQLFAFVAAFADLDPVFAKGHEKQRIMDARALVAQVVQP